MKSQPLAAFISQWKPLFFKAIASAMMVGAPAIAQAQIEIPTNYSTPNPNVENIIAGTQGYQQVSLTLDSTIPAPNEPSGRTDFSDGWMLEVYAQELISKPLRG